MFDINLDTKNYSNVALSVYPLYYKSLQNFENFEVTCNTKVTRRGSNPPTLNLALGSPISFLCTTGTSTKAFNFFLDL